MTEKEFIEAVGKVLGVKVGIIQAGVNVNATDHYKQKVFLCVIPTPAQAKKILSLGLEFSGLAKP